MSADVLHDDVGPRSIRDRAENGDSGVPESARFPKGWLTGEVLPQEYVEQDLPTETVVAFVRSEFPLHGSEVPNPRKAGRALVKYLPGKKHEELVLEDKNDPETATSAKVCVDLRIVHVADANDPKALVRAEFAALLRRDEKVAAALFDELRDTMADALGSA